MVMDPNGQPMTQNGVSETGQRLALEQQQQLRCRRQLQHHVDDLASNLPCHEYAAC